MWVNRNPEEGPAVFLPPLLLAVADLLGGFTGLIGLAGPDTAGGHAGCLAALTITGLLLAAARLVVPRDGLGASPAAVRTALRERTLRTAFLPRRDPDAAGRPRPRAPGPEIAAVPSISAPSRKARDVPARRSRLRHP